jgi:hypothetical protein
MKISLKPQRGGISKNFKRAKTNTLLVELVPIAFIPL